MNIHQIQMRYDESQDRILMRLSTTDNCEYRFWLTRRFVKRLWKLLVKMLDASALQDELSRDARRAMLEMQQEDAVRKSDFSKGFEEGSRHLPLGEAPVLIAKAKSKRRDDEVQLLSLHPQQGYGVDLALDAHFLHVLYKMLREAVAASDWDVKLALGETAVPAAYTNSAPPQKLH